MNIILLSRIQSEPHKVASLRSPRQIDISSELAELARSRMREVSFCCCCCCRETIDFYRS